MGLHQLNSSQKGNNSWWFCFVKVKYLIYWLLSDQRDKLWIADTLSNHASQLCFAILLHGPANKQVISPNQRKRVLHTKKVWNFKNYHILKWTFGTRCSKNKCILNNLLVVLCEKYLNHLIHELFDWIQSRIIQSSTHTAGLTLPLLPSICLKCPQVSVADFRKIQGGE